MADRADPLLSAAQLTVEVEAAALQEIDATLYEAAQVDGAKLGYAIACAEDVVEAENRRAGRQREPRDGEADLRSDAHQKRNLKP